MPRPKHPTLELARWYITRFEDDEAFADRALSKLFAIYPNNNQREDILLKVAALNSLYHTNVFAVDKMAKHIFGLLIDSKLENCSIDVVNEIAFLEIDGKTRRHYSFATKYCSWHKPEIYPIYDRYLEQLLWAYQKADRFASFERPELQNYATYKSVVENFRTHYGLSEFGFKRLDEFLWLYGKEYFGD